MKYFMFVLIAIVYISFVFISPLAIGLLILCVFAFTFCYHSPLKALSILIFLLPYGENPLLNVTLFNVSGIKPLNLLALFVILILILNLKNAKKLEAYVFFFAAILIGMFFLDIFRSMHNLNKFSYLLGDNVNTQKYILSFFIKPMISFVPFIVICKFAQEEKDVEFIIRVILITIFALSIFLLTEYLFYCPNKLNINYVRNFFGVVMGLHTNQIACFYILTFPLLLEEVFVKKTKFSFINLIVSVCATGVLYSRTAYFLLIFSVLFYLIISKKVKLLPVIGALCTIFILYLPSTIKERANIGLQDKNVDEISAGRVDRIWMPLIKEYLQDKKKLMIGDGRYSIYTTKAFSNGIMLSVSHPHNMYLGVVLECGLIGLIIILIIFGMMIRKIFYNIFLIKQNKFKEYQMASFAGIVGYFVAGLTGRTLFPDLQNFFLWIILAYSVVIIKLTQIPKDNTIK